MSGLSRRTDEWLGRAVTWRKEQLATPPNLTEQLVACPELAVYLTHLKQFIQKCDTVDAIMQQLPVVGQLLGRLCSLPALLQHDDVCAQLLGCLVGFCRPTPSPSLLEQKASTWAMNQIRSIVGGSDSSSHHLSGFPPHKFHVQAQALLEMQLAQNNVPSGLPDGVQQDERIMTHLRDMQRHPYTGSAPPVSGVVIEALWRRDAASLEHEVLDLVAAAAQIPPHNHQDDPAWQQLIGKVTARQLPTVWTNFPASWHMTHHLLMSIWNKTGHSTVRRLMISLTDLLPSSLQTSLSSSGTRILSGFSPSKLTVGSCSHLVHMVAESCSEGGWEKTWLMLHPQWFSALTLLPLITDSQVCSNCCKVLCAALGCAHQEECVRDFLDGLRGLLHKASLSIQDIQCVVPSAINSADPSAISRAGQSAITSAGPSAVLSAIPLVLTTHCLTLLLLLALHLPQQTTQYILQQINFPDVSSVIAETTKLLLEHSPIQAIDPEHIRKRSREILQEEKTENNGASNDPTTDALWDSEPDDLWS